VGLPETLLQSGLRLDKKADNSKDRMIITLHDLDGSFGTQSGKWTTDMNGKKSYVAAYSVGAKPAKGKTNGRLFVSASLAFLTSITQIMYFVSMD